MQRDENIRQTRLWQAFLERYPLATQVLLAIKDLPSGRQLKLLGWIVIGAFASALSPLFLSYFIRALGDANTMSLMAVAIMAGYFVMRLIDVVMANLRWIIVNPTLYLLSYQYAATSTQSIGDAYTSTLTDGDLSASETSKTVALVQNAQAAFMNTSYNVLCVLLPTAIATLVVVSVVFSQLGSMAFVVFLGGVVISLFAMFWGREHEANVFSRAVESDISVYSTVGEFVSNQQLVSEFSAKGHLEKSLAAEVARSLERHRAYFAIKCLNDCIRSSFGFTTYLLVMCLAIFEVSSELRTAADIFLIFAYMDRMNGPLADIARAVVSIRTNEASGEILERFVAGKGAVNGDGCARTSDGETVPPHERLFMEQVDHALREGQAFATARLLRVIGESGSGKTTFLRHLKAYLRLQFANTLRMCSLLSKVPTVRGSVSDNILLSEDGLDGALAQILLDQLLVNDQTFRRRVDLMEDVERLSGGELQALALVRVVMRGPQLVILDEATSAMDADLELHAIKFLRRQLPTAVIIVVSHRSSLDLVFDHHIYIDRWGPGSTQTF